MNSDSRAEEGRQAENWPAAYVRRAFDKVPDPAYLSLSLGRVQRFVTDARTTGDLWAGSTIMSWLARRAAEKIATSVCQEAVLIPCLQNHPFVKLLSTSPGPPRAAAVSVRATGFPNRLWVVVPKQDAATIAKNVENDLREKCNEILKGIGRTGDSTFPEVRWVTVEAAKNYADAWDCAGTALDARKRIRDFPAYARAGGGVCSGCGQRVAEFLGNRRLNGHVVRLRRGERLCVMCYVKRAFRVVAPPELKRALLQASFPSTASVASAPFRQQACSEANRPEVYAAIREFTTALDAVRQWSDLVHIPHDLQDALPGLRVSDDLPKDVHRDLMRFLGYDGEWCYPESWEKGTFTREHNLGDDEIRQIEGLLKQGQKEVLKLQQETLRQEPSSYLAVLMQDTDDMGKSLGGCPDPLGRTPTTPAPEWHVRVSHALVNLGATVYAEFVEKELGRVVYSGGDDLLAIVPVRGALNAAKKCRQALSTALPGLKASTSIVFFHYSYPLQEALRRAREALEEAKQPERGKDRLAIVVLRRGGPRAKTLLPWRGGRAAGAITQLAEMFSEPPTPGLSPRLLRDLEVDLSGLQGLSQPRLEKEVRRLVARHISDPSKRMTAGDLVLECLPSQGRGLREDEGYMWLGALYSALFIHKEGR